MDSHGPAPMIKLVASVATVLIGLGLTLLVIRQRGIDITRRAPALVVFITQGTTGAL